MSPRRPLCRQPAPEAPRPPPVARHLLHTGESATATYAGHVLATLSASTPVLPPFGLGSVVTEWGIDPFLTVVTVWVTGAYLLGVRALRGRGDAWSVARTAAFTGGMAVFYFATSSGLAAYDT